VPRAEIGTAAAVFGLLLLGYSWLVEDRHIYSRTAWKNMRPQAESQIRALLQFSECRVNTAVPSAFVHLAEVAEQLNAAREADEVCRDGLGCVIAMRNDVIHPTREKRMKRSFYQWSEAHSLAVHFLELAPACLRRLPRAVPPPDRSQPRARIRRRRPLGRLLTRSPVKLAVASTPQPGS
jgi:hypothetical protein